MAGFLYKGILLQQHKEPALSRDLCEFFNADTVSIQMQREAVSNPDLLTPAEIIDIAREANIFDERDGKSLVSKLNRCRGRSVRLLVADAIDDEPYISSQLNPLLKNQQLSAVGLQLAKRASGAKDACFAVYKNLTDLDIKIPKTIGDYPVRRIRGRYPADYQAARVFTAGQGVLVIGAGAILHLARAVVFNKPQTTTFLTVAGNCIGNPTNLEVSIDMTVGQVLERCGLIFDPTRVVIGGSMTGISVIDTENTRIKPSIRAILAFREEEKDLNFGCIGCSRCVHVCPEGLNPFFLYRSAKHKRYEDFRQLDPQMCIGCGTCSYMCPAKLDLSETIRDCAQSFRPVIGAMRASSVAQTKRKKLEFEEYMEQYRSEKANRELLRAERRAAAEERRENAAKIRDEKQQAKEAERRLREKAKTEAARVAAEEAAAKAAEEAVVSAAKAAEDAARIVAEAVAMTPETLPEAAVQELQTAAQEVLLAAEEITVQAEEIILTVADEVKSLSDVETVPAAVVPENAPVMSETEIAVRESTERTRVALENAVKNTEKALRDLSGRQMEFSPPSDFSISVPPSDAAPDAAESEAAAEPELDTPTESGDTQNGWRKNSRKTGQSGREIK